jgi:hypothetical protein
MSSNISTISSGATVTLASSLTGNITFSNAPADSGVLLIDPGALSFGPSSSNVVSTYLGGNIVNFSPGDTIIVANVEQDGHLHQPDGLSGLLCCGRVVAGTRGFMSSCFGFSALFRVIR